MDYMPHGEEQSWILSTNEISKKKVGNNTQQKWINGIN